MSLHARIADSAALAQGDEFSEDGGLRSFSADLFTANWVVRAELTSPEVRLSDHLNGFSSTVDVRPSSAAYRDDDTLVDLAGTFASLTKDCILLAIPVLEPIPQDGTDRTLWRPTQQCRCWLALGPYRILGTLHFEMGRDPRVALRMTDKQFVPVTNISLSTPAGATRQHPVVFINRSRLDLLAVKDEG